ncbi:hypothetical protein ABIC28_002996 [Rhodococcus sp. PvR044]|uniref:hypothetical protein n=1 Tax=Rhodococcus sp. PvR044 TaxID=3156402 RepID=UPI00339272FC
MTLTTAGAALIISIVALLYNVVNTWIRWPRVSVVMNQSVVVTPTTSPQDTYRLVVINSGAEATTIANVGIRTADHSITIDVAHEREKERGVEVDGPELPVRIEAHGCLVWKFTPQAHDRIKSGTAISGYAHRYKPFLKYPKKSRTMIREHRTNVDLRKN